MTNATYGNTNPDGQSVPQVLGEILFLWYGPCFEWFIAVSPVATIKYVGLEPCSSNSLL